MKKRAIVSMVLALAVFASSPVFAESININTADAVTISEQLPGIGLKKAQAIIDYRNQHGPFQSVDDLDRVNGIGKKLVDANRDKITVSAPPAASSM